MWYRCLASCLLWEIKIPASTTTLPIEDKRTGQARRAAGFSTIRMLEMGCLRSFLRPPVPTMECWVFRLFRERIRNTIGQESYLDPYSVFLRPSGGQSHIPDCGPPVYDRRRPSSIIQTPVPTLETRRSLSVKSSVGLEGTASPFSFLSFFFFFF